MTSRILRTLLSLLLIGGLAQAQILVFQVQLDGSQVNPPVNTPATGSATVTLNLQTRGVTVNGTYMNLSSQRSNQHIHGPAGPGMNAGPIVALNGTGSTSGTITGGGQLSPQEVIDMKEGRTYINVHSFSHFSGEIRGQIPATVGVPALGPKPLALSAALLLGLGTVLVVRRRRLASPRPRNAR